MNHVSFQAFGQHCLGAFSQFVPASEAAFYLIDAQLRAHDFQLRGMQPTMHDAYPNHYLDLDPLGPRRSVTPDDPATPPQRAL